EAECAGPGISRYYARLTGSPEFVPASEIARRAEAGEEAALETYRREGRVLGHALANASNILNPSKIIIGGGVSRSWKLFYPTLEESFRKIIFHRANDSILIEPTALGYEAALMGAVALTLQK
ncbi:MAG: ROK family protein, partial [Thermoguttaceae bacterium]|nr:ROK family protein [Thermoguttaceae bacterium]